MKGRGVAMLMFAVVLVQTGRGQVQGTIADIRPTGADTSSTPDTKKDIRQAAAQHGAKRLQIASPSVRRGSSTWTHFASVHDNAAVSRRTRPSVGAWDTYAYMVNNFIFRLREC